MLISKRLLDVIPFANVFNMKGSQYIVNLTTDAELYAENPAIVSINIHDDNRDCFDVRRDGKITFWPSKKGEQPVNDNGFWMKAGREELRPGKFLKTFRQHVYAKTIDGTVPVTDDIYNAFTELFAARIASANEGMKLLISSNVAEIYDIPNYAGCNIGNLSDSCMKHAGSYGCAPHKEMYNLIPGLRVMYGLRDSKLFFRALLWPTENGPFVDRVYGNNAAQQFVINIAKEKNWLWRSMNDRTIMRGESIHNISIDMPVTNEFIEYAENEGCAYFDTINKLDIDCQILSNVGGEYYLTSCDGETIGGMVCERCCCSMARDDGYTTPGGNLLCEGCYYENYFCCEYCGDMEPVEEMITLSNNETWCSHCADNHAARCERCEEIIADQNGEMIIVRDTDGELYAVCEDCVGYYYQDICNECGIHTDGTCDNDLCCECQGNVECAECEYREACKSDKKPEFINPETI